MALTVSSAVKTYVEGLGLGLSVDRDEAPPGVKPPYVTVQEYIGFKPDPLSSIETPQTGVEIVQVDVWYAHRDAYTAAEKEDPAKVAALIRALQMARIAPFGSPSNLVYACLVRSVNRLIEKDADTPGGDELVHYAITCHVWREF